MPDIAQQFADGLQSAFLTQFLPTVALGLVGLLALMAVVTVVSAIAARA